MADIAGTQVTYKLPIISIRHTTENDYIGEGLDNGMEVLAKLYKGELCSVKYANRTQAYKKQAELGDGWTVCQFLGRPFYVVKIKE